MSRKTCPDYCTLLIAFRFSPGGAVSTSTPVRCAVPSRRILLSPLSIVMKRGLQGFGRETDG